MRKHEAGHVVCRGREPACRSFDRRHLPDGVPGKRLPRREQIGTRLQRSEPCRQGHAETRVLHAECAEYVLLDIVVEWLTRHTRDDVAGQVQPVVRVGRNFPRRIDPIRDAEHVIAQRLRRVVACIGRLLEARRVRQQIAQSDRLAERRRNLEIQVFVDIAIQVELALLDQLHHSRRSESLRDRCNAHDTAPWIHRDAGRDIGIPVALLEQHLALLDD